MNDQERLHVCSSSINDAYSAHERERRTFQLANIPHYRVDFLDVHIGIIRRYGVFRLEESEVDGDDDESDGPESEIARERDEGIIEWC